MNIKSGYISLYVVPAFKNSLNIFDEYGVYIFSDNKNNAFFQNEFNKADYIGLGSEFKLENEGSEYIKLKKIGKIEEIGKFEIDYDDYNITSFNILEGGKIEKNNLEQAFTIQIDAYHKFRNNQIMTSTKKKQCYIYVKLEEVGSKGKCIISNKNSYFFPFKYR